MRWSNVWKH